MILSINFTYSGMKLTLTHVLQYQVILGVLPVAPNRGNQMTSPLAQIMNDQIVYRWKFKNDLTAMLANLNHQSQTERVKESQRNTRSLSWKPNLFYRSKRIRCLILIFQLASQSSTFTQKLLSATKRHLQHQDQPKIEHVFIYWSHKYRSI